MAIVSSIEPPACRTRNGWDAFAGWWSRRSPRVATWGLVVVLVGVSGFALAASQYSALVTSRALAASRLSADYAEASRALADEGSLGHKYRLDPDIEVLARFYEAAGHMVEALDRVRAGGDDVDVAEAREILALHSAYLDAVDKMFAAVDRGDETAASAIAEAQVEPLSAAVVEPLGVATRLHEDRSLRALEILGRIEQFSSTATLVVFVLGLLLVAVWATVLRRVRRELASQAEQVLHNSLHDALTGLPNRLLLADRFDQALTAGRRDNHLTGLLLIDLDHFKEVNDTLGHHVGDLLLAQIGPRLATALRAVDTIARLGGDEFAVLLPTVESLAEAIMVAERINAALSTPFAVEGVDFAVEASIGVVVSGAHGDDPTSLFQHADVAMYVAKEQGIGVFAYRPDLDDHSPDRFALLSEFRRALDCHEFVMHYQPQVSLTSWDICGVEALVRWQHPTRGLIPPDQFIQVAEHTALIGPLTRRIFDLALAQVRTWLDAGFRIPVAVNLSSRNLLDNRFVDEILERLSHHGVPADLLWLEVTESAITTEPARAKLVLTRLHEQGIRIAFDDFGARYMSLAQLKDLPVTTLKINRALIAALDSDPSHALLVRSVVELGHNLGLTVVASGVETDAVLAMLSDNGCDVAQGYRLSPPLPPNELLACYTNVQAL